MARFADATTRWRRKKDGEGGGGRYGRRGHCFERSKHVHLRLIKGIRKKKKGGGALNDQTKKKKGHYKKKKKG
jgi:hypothetical protein